MKTKNLNSILIYCLIVNIFCTLSSCSDKQNVEQNIINKKHVTINPTQAHHQSDFLNELSVIKASFSQIPNTNSTNQNQPGNNDQLQEQKKNILKADLEGAKEGWKEGFTAGGIVGELMAGQGAAGAVLGGLIGSVTYGASASIQKANESDSTNCSYHNIDDVVALTLFDELTCGNVGYYHNYIITTMNITGNLIADRTPIQIFDDVYTAANELDIDLNDDIHDYLYSHAPESFLNLDNRTHPIDEQLDIDLADLITDDYIDYIFTINPDDVENYTYELMQLIENYFENSEMPMMVNLLNSSISVGYYSYLLWNIEVNNL